PIPTWALLNLLSSIATVLVGGVMIGTYFKKKEEDEEEEDDDTTSRTINNEDEEEDEDGRKKSKFLGAIPSVASVITFILTEDMHNKMAMTDKWTLLMVAMLVVNGIAAYLTRNKKDEKEDEEEDA
ncbi:MAG: hypothetical protein Q4D71_09675, partial [Oscillospiraceae bacterium]|nr:hypothetical protein [Oscillospiraceae bacterium]